MKRSELRQMIREEVKGLSEVTDLLSKKRLTKQEFNKLKKANPDEFYDGDYSWLPVKKVWLKKS